MKNDFEKLKEKKLSPHTAHDYSRELLAETKRFLDYQLEILKSKLKQETQSQVLEQFNKLRENLKTAELEAFADYEESMKVIEAEEKKLSTEDTFGKQTIELRKKRLKNSLNRILDFNKKTLTKFVEEFL